MRFGAALIISLAGPVLAGEFSLQTPVDCPVGEDQPCYIQNYVDRDPGPDAQDFTCNALSYDTHKGTDFALRSHAEIAKDVPVLAAADGVVKGTRDGMADKLYTPADQARINGRECGNGLVIDHGDGWETQYCHLRRGSVAVQSGQQVQAGETLGYVGMSGKAAFPHLHLSVRRDGVPVDPFAPDATAQCSPETGDTLWSDPLRYQPGGLIGIGFSDAVPEYDAIKEGTAATTALTGDAAALVIWGFAFGSRPGDELRMEIIGPTGAKIFETDVELDRTQAQFFRAAGRRTNGAGWFIPGTYSGRVEMRRDGTVISDMITSVTVSD